MWDVSTVPWVNIMLWLVLPLHSKKQPPGHAKQMITCSAEALPQFLSLAKLLGDLGVPAQDHQGDHLPAGTVAVAFSGVGWERLCISKRISGKAVRE